ncbi:O-antigen ligase family protein [Priestia megaterium]|uniref:O-antigen ligase family protein n=1 Tax=Priestia megaterium TaxID=1404 RepID=UPI0032D99D27
MNFLIYIYFLLNVMFFLFGYDFLSKNVAYGIYAIIVYVFVINIILRLKYLWRINKVTIFFIIFLIYIFASCIWSEHIRQSIILILPYIAATVLAIHLRWVLKFDKVLNLIKLAILISLILSLLTVIFIPSIGIMDVDGEGAWQGIYGFKNKFGTALVLLTVLYLLKIKHSRILLGYLCVLMVLFITLMTKSSSSILIIGVLILSLLAIKLFSRLKQTTGKSLFTLISSIALIVIILCVSPYIIISLLGKDLSFTGRTVIWQDIFNYMPGSWFFGHGYGILEGGTSIIHQKISLDLNIRIFSAHNGYIEFLLNVGLIGLIGFIGTFIFGFKLTKNFSKSKAIQIKILLLTLLLINLPETRILSNYSMFYWMMYVYIMFYIYTTKRKTFSKSIT